MFASTNSQLEMPSSPSSSAKDANLSYSNFVIGAAVFDLSGLPKEYFTTTESTDVSWVQTIFQALGLQSLLMSSLRLEGFRHVVVHGKEYRAIVVKQRSRYTAVLVRPSHEVMSEAFIRWAHELEPSRLKTDPRFSVV
ncbi:MAG: hypothetical protein Kow00121_33020 [Elainellaceae cyanobacterium]